MIPRGTTFEFEYLGEFEIEINTILEHESGAHMGLIHEKNQRPKISCYCTFKIWEARDTHPYGSCWCEQFTCVIFKYASVLMSSLLLKYQLQRFWWVFLYFWFRFNLASAVGRHLLWAISVLSRHLVSADICFRQTSALHRHLFTLHRHLLWANLCNKQVSALCGYRL